MLKTARSSAKRGLTLVLNTASEVLMTEGSAENVKKTYHDLVRAFKAFHNPWENFKTSLEDENDLEG